MAQNKGAHELVFAFGAAIGGSLGLLKDGVPDLIVKHWQEYRQLDTIELAVPDDDVLSSRG